MYYAVIYAVFTLATHTYWLTGTEPMNIKCAMEWEKKTEFKMWQLSMRTLWSWSGHGIEHRMNERKPEDEPSCNQYSAWIAFEIQFIWLFHWEDQDYRRHVFLFVHLASHGLSKVYQKDFVFFPILTLVFYFYIQPMLVEWISFIDFFHSNTNSCFLFAREFDLHKWITHLVHLYF